MNVKLRWVNTVSDTCTAFAIFQKPLIPGSLQVAEKIASWNMALSTQRKGQIKRTDWYSSFFTIVKKKKIDFMHILQNTR